MIQNDWFDTFMEGCFIPVLKLAFVCGIVACAAACPFFMVTLLGSSSGGPVGYKTSVSNPPDVCPQTRVVAAIQDRVLTMDYVNLHGDRVYLVYALSVYSDPEFKSKQVIDGDDCKM